MEMVVAFERSIVSVVHLTSWLACLLAGLWTLVTASPQTAGKRSPSEGRASRCPP